MLRNKLPTKSAPPCTEPDAMPAQRRSAAPAEARIFSRNTERAIKADMAVYTAWCRARSLPPLPADPAAVTAFVDAMARKRAPATVRRYVASIGVVQRSIGCPEPVQGPTVRQALQRMHQANGRRQQQVLALNWPLRRRLVEAAGDRLIDARNKALIAVAYDAMLRRSELTALAVADLSVHGGDAATLLVRRAKTDREGCGAAVYLAPDTVALVQAWIARSSVTDGHLFRSVTRAGQVGSSLDPSQVPRIFKGMALRAGLPPDVATSLSGHSARIGAAQDMIAAGIELPAILQAGRWKSTAMVIRYGERLLAARGGAAMLAAVQGRG